MNLPSVEALELRHTFPCPYVFKVIGKADDNFLARVINCVRDELQLEEDPPFKLKTTKNGQHVSITLEPHVTDAQQVLALYSRISQTTGLVMWL